MFRGLGCSKLPVSVIHNQYPEYPNSVQSNIQFLLRECGLVIAVQTKRCQSNFII